MGKRIGKAEKKMGFLKRDAGGGLYMHIPFCKQACYYCNFHFSTQTSYKDQMVAALCREMELRSDYFSGRPLASLYFGGGTPSLLSPQQLDILFGKAKEVFGLEDAAEVTLEANPDDLDRGKLQYLYNDSPVNRLSIGIQSFHNEDLRYMNRVHSAAEGRKCLDAALDAGFDNYSIDLIYGLPTLGEKEWRENLEIAFGYGVRHLSCYNLTVEDKTALAHRIRTGKCEAPEEEAGREHFSLLMDELDKRGYIHYEISNAARSEGDIAMHNSSYWTDQPYLGIGPSAHSYNGSRRFWNVANNHRYMRAIYSDLIPAEYEQLSPVQKYNEWVMTGLRTIWGLDEDELADFPELCREEFRKGSGKFIQRGLLKRNDRFITLGREGRFLADYIASELMVAQ